MSDYLPAFATQQIIARVRGAIAQHNISQAQLAILCDTSQSQFSKIIRGTRPMTVDHLVVLADALDLDLGAIISEVDELVYSTDRAPSAVVFVEEGITLEEPIVRGADFVDAFGKKARARLGSAPLATVKDLSDLATVHHLRGEAPTDERLAAKRGRRKADEPHAE